MSCYQSEQAAARWQALVDALNLPPQRGNMLFELLQEQYAGEQRVYHCLEHVLSVLDIIDALAAYASDVHTVKLAAWFHDVVYDPAAADNEKQSADCAARALPGSGLPPHQVAEVERLILLTKDHRIAPGDRNGAVLLDADLAILGEERLVYQAYAQAIRAEYASVPDEQYRQGRLHILRTFLERPSIYHTLPMRQQREVRARRNLAEEIEFLAQSLSS